MGALNPLKSALVTPELYAAKCLRAGGLRHCQAELRNTNYFACHKMGPRDVTLYIRVLIWTYYH
jgi:hypothetical protein